MSSPMQNPAIVEYLAGKPRTAFTLAEYRAQGASEADLANLVSALMATDAAFEQAGYIEDPEDPFAPWPDTPEVERTINHMGAMHAAVAASLHKTGFVEQGGLQ